MWTTRVKTVRDVVTILKHSLTPAWLQCGLCSWERKEGKGERKGTFYLSREQRGHSTVLPLTCARPQPAGRGAAGPADAAPLPAPTPPPYAHAKCRHTVCRIFVLPQSQRVPPPMRIRPFYGPKNPQVNLFLPAIRPINGCVCPGFKDPHALASGNRPGARTYYFPRRQPHFFPVCAAAGVASSSTSRVNNSASLIRPPVIRRITRSF